MITNYKSRMNERCRNLGGELAELKELRDDFARAFELGVRDGDLNGEKLRNLRDVVNALLKGDTGLAKLREEKLPRSLEHLNLREQYESQVKVAWKSGLFGDGLNKAENGGAQLHVQPEGGRVNLSGQAEKSLYAQTGVMGKTLPVIERNGKKYPMPSWKEVQKILRKPKNCEIIKEKAAQGFTQMLIVPFGFGTNGMKDRCFIIQRNTPPKTKVRRPKRTS